jgi:hypothetical protein
VNRFFLLCLLIFSASASATITISSVTGASNTPAVGVAGQGVTLYAGMSGASGTCTPNGDGTCNSCSACTGTPALCACNTKAVVNSTPVTILFFATFATVDTTHFIAITNQSGTPLSATQLYTGPNVQQTMSLTWTNLCQAGFGLQCSDVTTGQTAGIRIGVWDGNSMVDNVVLTINVLAPTIVSVDDCTQSASTICKFHAYAGDQSVYIRDPQGDGTYPGTTAAIRFFVSDSSFDKADLVNNIKTKDFPVSADGSLGSNIIDGLNNDPPNPYYFRSAAVDQAGNVFGFVSDANIQAADFGNCTSGFPSPPTAPDDGCLYKATPDAVLGLLTKDLNCFIATASYGSSLEPKLNTFREFRNRFLIGSKIGRNLVMNYYHYGPYAARWIADRDWARAVSRTFLWPLWTYTLLANHLGLEVATIAFFMTLIILSVFFAALTAWMVRDSKA